MSRVRPGSHTSAGEMLQVLGAWGRWCRENARGALAGSRAGPHDVRGEAPKTHKYSVAEVRSREAMC